MTATDRSSTNHSSSDLSRAAAALFLCAWWGRPTERQRELWNAAWDDAELTALSFGEPIVDGVTTLRQLDRESEIETLLNEYELLLVGPGRPRCPPYESLWRFDGPPNEYGTLMGKIADTVAGLYRRLGVKPSRSRGELPDHLLLEWEATAYSLEHHHELAHSLLSDHLAHWIPAFCDAVAAQSTEPFYRQLAELTVTWTNVLTP